MVTTANWRQLGEADIPALLEVQKEAYPWHQEGPAMFLDRMRIYPHGCLALDGPDGMLGYILSHPWHTDDPPPLDTLIGRLPERTGTYYLHDLALLKAAHGQGLGARLVRHLAEHAGTCGYTTMSLVAVNNSAPFWERQGFAAREVPNLAAKLKTYGPDAVFMTRALD